jgi:protease-4
MPEGPVRVQLEQRRSFWGKLSNRFLWIALVVAILVIFNQRAMYQDYFANPADNITERYHSLSKEAENKIAILSVEGAILSGDGFVKKQIDRIREDKNVKAVVLRVNSPGGTVTGSDYIYHHLKKLLAEKHIPMVVSMGSIAASGGYYISMAAGDGEKLIFAEPTSWTGSIGVIIPHYDISGLLEKWNVKDDSIASGPFKQMASPTQLLTPPEREKERALLQTLVNESFAGFKQLVLDSRAPLRNDPALQETVFTGQIFTARQAKANGLVDELGFIEDAIDRALQLAKLSKDNVRVVEYKQPLGVFSELLGANAQSGRASFDLAQFLDLTAPRAYFLCTWLPSVVVSVR